MSEPIKMPQLGSDMTEGTLLNWTKKVGDQINAGDVIAEIETDKATVEVEAQTGGTILQLIGSPGEMLQVGAVIGYIGEAGEMVAEAPAPAPKAAEAPAPQPAPQAAPAPQPVAAPTNGGSYDGNYPGGVKASPIARKIAAERGIDLRSVRGTGPGGRITRSDVETFTVSPVTTPGAGVIAAPTYGELPTSGDLEIIEVSRLRTRIAKRMIESKQQVPHFYVTTECDVEALLAMRQQVNATLDESQKVSVNDLVVKAAALALRDFPNLNSHFYGDKIAVHKRINIGIAVALPTGGLMNIVAQDADKITLSTLAQRNKEMIARAREGKVKPEDVQGSTFTVSNLGAYDVDHFVAIINPPEAAILAVGAAKKIPVVLPDGTLGVGSRMKVTVSVDHRVSDGAEGAAFLQAFKAFIENPMRLLL